MNAFTRATQHYARQAMTPGWWLAAQEAVQGLETGKSTADTFKGLRAAVGAVVASAGYKPARQELAPLWIEKKHQGVTK